MIKSSDVVCFSLSDWRREMPSNRYHILTRFAKYNRVFLFERQVVPLLRDRHRWFSFFNIRQEDRFIIITPGLATPFGWFNNFIYRLYLRYIFKKFQLQKPIFWFYNFNLAFVLKDFPYLISCYHATEDYAHLLSFGQSKNRTSIIADREKTLVRKVDLVFAVSEHLANKHRRINPGTFLVSNAVEYRLYAQAQKQPRHRRFGRGPVLGYAGNLSAKVDFTLLVKIAAAFPEAKLVLAGPISVESPVVERLKGFKNVKFLPVQPLAALVGVYRQFDVCLIPYIQEKWFVRASQPLKLFEYLATGKPIVSTPMDCLKKLDGLVYEAKTAQEYFKKIRLALKENDFKLRLERIRVARQNTWDDRFNQINQAMEEFLEVKRE